MDGQYIYCFSNEHWSANSKEVSFNVHGIVYVPESEAPQDPLEGEGKTSISPCRSEASQAGWMLIKTRSHSPPALRTPRPSQRRTSLHRRPRTHAQKHSRKHKRAGQVVVDIPVGCVDRRGSLSSLVVEAFLRGEQSSSSIISLLHSAPKEGHPRRLLPELVRLLLADHFVRRMGLAKRSGLDNVIFRVQRLLFWESP